MILRSIGFSSVQSNFFISLTLALFSYEDPMPSIGIYIKLNQIQTRTNLNHKPQWIKWCKIQNLLVEIKKIKVSLKDGTLREGFRAKIFSWVKLVMVNII